MRYLSVVFLLVVLVACRVDDSNLTIGYNNSSVGKIKTHGYYFSTNPAQDIIIPYRNGVLLYARYEYNVNNLDEFEIYLVENNGSSNGEYKPLWGSFEIVDTSIHAQAALFKGGLVAKYSDYVRYDYYGNVLNDTTFTFYMITNDDGMGPIMVNDTFHFRENYHKPDSINDFVPN